MFFARYAPSQNLEASLLETPRINMMFGGDWPVVSSTSDSLAQASHGCAFSQTWCMRLLSFVLACIQERTAAISQTLQVEVCVVGDEEGALLQ